MITLDRTIKANVPLYDIEDSRVESWCRHWASRPGFNRLDSIRTTEADMSDLVNVLESMHQNSSDLVEHPALQEFELVVAEPIPSMQMTVVRFKKSILPSEPVREYGDGGVWMEYRPRIDAFISFRNSVEVDAVMTIFTFHMFAEDGHECTTGTANREFWRNANPQLNYTIHQNEDWYFETLRDIKLAYVAIQKALVDKPVVFRCQSEKRVSSAQSSHQKKKHRNRVRVVKSIVVNQEELKKYAAPVKHMKCRCWGVMGHWRSYKSGKQVWIAPYQKGKERYNQAAYVSKDYLVEG